MTDIVPDGPTDPRLSAVEDSTTVVTPPGYGSPISPQSPAAPPNLPPTELVGGPPASPPPQPGRVYATGETQVTSGPPGPPAPPRRSDRGKTTIAEEVVERVIEKVVNLTVDEVAGVHGLHISDTDQPVKVQLDGDNAIIDITVDIDFGHAVHDVVENVRGNVIDQSEQLLGLTVTEVNVLVADVKFDTSED